MSNMEQDSSEQTAPGPSAPPEGAPESTTPDLPMGEDELERVLESLVFVADQPVSAVRLSRITKTNLALVRQTLKTLVERYQGRGLELCELANGFQFRSAAETAPYVRELIRQRPVRLTRAQLEALSIVAYRQPVTRPELEDIRGVDSGSALKVLLERGLLRILGRKEEPGRPLLYGTSTQFLSLFGLKNLSDLPTLREFSELSEESRALFERRMGEPLDDDAEAALGSGVVPAVTEPEEDSEAAKLDDTGDSDEVAAEEDDPDAQAEGAEARAAEDEWDDDEDEDEDEDDDDEDEWDDDDDPDHAHEAV